MRLRRTTKYENRPVPQRRRNEYKEVVPIFIADVAKSSSHQLSQTEIATIHVVDSYLMWGIIRAIESPIQRLVRFIRSVIREDPSQPAVALRLFLS